MLIPDELREREQWICWRTECRECGNRLEPTKKHCPDCGEKATKKPVNPQTGGFARSNDPETWVPYESAAKHNDGNPDTDGLGFMFDDDGLLSGVDLDDCRHPETGEIDEWARDVIDDLDSFTEVSPSGTGLHVIVFGILPDGGNRSDVGDGEIEMYDSRRYFTVTGEHVAGTPKSVNRRAESLRGVHDRYVSDDTDEVGETDTDLSGLDGESPSEFSNEFGTSLATIRERDEKLDRLLGQLNPGGYENDTSRADMATAVKLVYWRFSDHDIARILRQYRSREKTSERDDYLETTIENAKRKQTEQCGPPKQQTKRNESGGRSATAEGEGHSWEYVVAQYDQDKSLGRVAAADALEHATDWMYVVESDKLWVYDDERGYYNPWGEQKAHRTLESRLGNYYTQQEAREIVGRIRARNQTHRTELNARKHDSALLCVGNGVVNLETGELSDHSPDYKFTRGLSWDYDPANADPDPVLEFLDDVTQRECDRDTLLDHLAHGLMPGYPYRAFVMMYGPGSNGKTRVGKLFRGFVGEENAAAVELQDLTGDDSFATGGLPGAFVNIGDDISVGEVRDTSILKSLTGDGTVTANEKYEKQYEFENEAAMFFSANEPPRFKEKTDAVSDRLYPIEMPYRFVDEPSEPDEKKKVPGIADELLDDDDAMRGLLLLSVKHAQEVIERKGQYSMPEGPKERRERYESASDPIQRFALTHLEPADSSGVVVKDDVYSVYTAMCDRQGERPTSEQKFKQKVGQMASLDVEDTQSRAVTAGDSRDRCWRYVEFAESAREFMPARLERRYFEGDTAEESDGSDGLAHGATRIANAARTLTGYVTVTAEIVTVDTYDGDSTPTTKAILRDESGAMDFVTWDADLSEQLREMEGETVAIKNAEVGEYEGTRQLQAVEGLTAVERIQQGVGATEAPPPEDDGQESLAAADGGEIEGTKGKVMEQMKQSHADETVTVATLAGEIDESPESVDGATETLASDGRLIRDGDDVRLA